MSTATETMSPPVAGTATVTKPSSVTETSTVIVTDKAVGEIRRVMSEQSFPETTFLRIGIAAGGCSGFQYSLGFDDKFDGAKDQMSTQHGLKVVVDKKSSLYLEGTTIDFYEGLEKRGFTFNNPNVVKSCGCGSSFSA